MQPRHIELGVGRNRHSLVLSALLMVAFAYSSNNQRSIEFQGRREMALALENFALCVEGQSLESRKYSWRSIKLLDSDRDS